MQKPRRKSTLRAIG